jgi:hypothetical protein
VGKPYSIYFHNLLWEISAEKNQLFANDEDHWNDDIGLCIDNSGSGVF